MDVEIDKALQYAQKLLDASINIVAVAHVEIDASGARNPKIVALSLLCRSLSNFRAAILLTQQRHVIEARALVRCLYENLLWIGALRERGSLFVQDMLQDEAFNRKALGELTLKMSSKHGADPDDASGLHLRSLINELAKQFPSTEKNCHAGKTAAVSAVELSYVEYMRFSLDAVHCSITALGRHVATERDENKTELTVNVEARTTPAEMRDTILHACRALMGVAVATNELLGFTKASASIAALADEFFAEHSIS